MKKLLFFLLTLLPVLLHAQVKPENPEPPPGKGRIVVIFYMYRYLPQRGLLNKLPVFLNDSLICRVPNKTYTIHDVDTGVYTIAADLGVKKPTPRTERQEIYVEDGNTLYFEMVGVTEKIIKSTVQIIPLRPQEAIALMKELKPLEECGATKPEPEDPFINRKYFLSILAGNTFPVQNYVSWWPVDLQPLAPKFNPWVFGFEAGVRLGPNNHFASFHHLNSTQPSITDSGLTRREWIAINHSAIYYAYAFKLDRKNRFLLLPKIGLGYFNYVRENRSEFGGGGFGGESSFASIFAAQSEFRLSRTFSLHANWEYQHGKVTIANRDIRLDQHRLFAGIKAQFEIQ